MACLLQRTFPPLSFNIFVPLFPLFIIIGDLYRCKVRARHLPVTKFRNLLHRTKVNSVPASSAIGKPNQLVYRHVTPCEFDCKVKILSPPSHPQRTVSQPRSERRMRLQLNGGFHNNRPAMRLSVAHLLICVSLTRLKRRCVPNHSRFAISDKRRRSMTTE